MHKIPDPSRGTLSAAVSPAPGRLLQYFLRLVCIVTNILAVALMAGSAHAADYLDPEAAFKFSARMVDEHTVEARYEIADGYYMYRDRFEFRAAGATLGAPVLPQGKVKYDDTFKKDVETYRQSVAVRIPISANGRFVLTAVSQGCADKGLCYSPMESTATLSTSGSAVLAGVAAAQHAIDPATDAPLNLSGRGARPTDDSDVGRLEASLQSGKLLAILPLFFLLGLGLSFTPCVLPMVPIVSFIIVGQGVHTSRARGLALSGTYSFGMALVYTALGIAAGLIGEGLAAALQNPWVLSAFGTLLVLLSLSMFGVYQLQLPASLQTRMVQFSERQPAGKYLGVFAMGAISALVIGPCVAAPLAAALLYISQTRDIVIGGAALFTMAAGMSVPLLLVGVSAGTLLPRAGAWMQSVKHLFGVLMLGLAIWVISPIISPSLQMAGWAALGIGYGAYLLFARRARGLGLAVGLLVSLFGLIQFAGLASGGRDAFAPLAHLSSKAHGHVAFVRVKSIADLDRALAATNGKTAMLDFYADWCVSCKEMEKFTFADPRVRSVFSDMVLLQADVTANDADDKALLKRFRLFGPPGIIFFDRTGREIPGARVIGYKGADEFLPMLQAFNEP